MPRLLHELAVGRGDGSYTRMLTRLAKLDLLAIDDWILAPLRDAERRDLTEIIEDRAERASTLIASQLPVADWHTVIGDPNQADAICDRLMSIAQRAADAGDRPVASDRSVDRAGPMENACDTPCNLDDAVGTRFPQALGRRRPPSTRSTRVLVVGSQPTIQRARPRSPGTFPTEVTG